MVCTGGEWAGHVGRASDAVMPAFWRVDKYVRGQIRACLRSNARSIHRDTRVTSRSDGDGAGDSVGSWKPDPRYE